MKKEQLFASRTGQQGWWCLDWLTAGAPYKHVGKLLHITSITIIVPGQNLCLAVWQLASRLVFSRFATCDHWVMSDHTSSTRLCPLSTFHKPAWLLQLS
jgi:hypothetical protein